MQQRGAPTVAVNGNTAGITGTLPNNNDSTIARQADRSGYPRTAVLTFPGKPAGSRRATRSRSPTAPPPPPAPASAGTRSCSRSTRDVPAAPARLSATTTRLANDSGVHTWRISVRNDGDGTAHDVRVVSVAEKNGKPARVVSRDPNQFPVPIAALLTPGESASTEIRVSGGQPVDIALSADGGRTRARA